MIGYKNLRFAYAFHVPLFYAYCLPNTDIYTAVEMRTLPLLQRLAGQFQLAVV